MAQPPAPPLAPASASTPSASPSIISNSHHPRPLSPLLIASTTVRRGSPTLHPRAHPGDYSSIDLPRQSPTVSHRSSYADNLRNYPPSPRSTRAPSFSGAALTELLMHPTARTNGDDARFRGRDWRTIHIAEIIDPTETRFVELENTSIEDTTKLLIRSGPPNVVLIRESRKTRTVIGTFDYSDLNSYLLLVLGLSQPDALAQKLAERARSGDTIPLSDVNDHLGPREEPAFLPHTANLTQATEVLGGGAHRVIVCKEGSSEAIGVLSQVRLVRFFWDNHQNFAATESLYSRTLTELRIGAKEVLAINGDKPLADALRLMHAEGITSLPVLDSNHNVVGNISHVDVRLLTDTSAIPLLSASCLHFISVILSERGMYDGKDSYPVFHVTPVSTLAHTVAKLCATRSHRMWIVDAPSPSSSIPPSPGGAAIAPPSMQHGSAPTAFYPRSRPNSIHIPDTPTTPITAGGPPYTATTPAGAGTGITAAQLPGAGMSGRLTGVISLTDVLNLFARASGLSPRDPEEMRRRRRRSSSSSSRQTIGAEGVRASAEMGRG